jgi:hypothetical protein
MKKTRRIDLNTFYELFKRDSQRIDNFKLQIGSTGKHNTRWKDKFNLRRKKKKNKRKKKRSRRRKGNKIILCSFFLPCLATERENPTAHKRTCIPVLYFRFVSQTWRC